MILQGFVIFYSTFSRSPIMKTLILFAPAVLASAANIAIDTTLFGMTIQTTIETNAVNSVNINIGSVSTGFDDNINISLTDFLGSGWTNIINPSDSGSSSTQEIHSTFISEGKSSSVAATTEESISTSPPASATPSQSPSSGPPASSSPNVTSPAEGSPTPVYPPMGSLPQSSPTSFPTSSSSRPTTSASFSTGAGVRPTAAVAGNIVVGLVGIAAVMI